jgi:hypothetical protein
MCDCDKEKDLPDICSDCFRLEDKHDHKYEMSKDSCEYCHESENKIYGACTKCNITWCFKCYCSRYINQCDNCGSVLCPDCRDKSKIKEFFCSGCRILVCGQCRKNFTDTDDEFCFDCVKPSTKPQQCDILFKIY